MTGVGAGAWAAGARLAITLLTIVPLPAPRTGAAAGPGRDTARRAMLLAPLAGLLVGGAAAATLLLGDLLGLAPAPRAALAVAAMAVLTRALHLDGLADLADGLGSGRPAADALAIMKRSDIGPFGVVTLLLTLIVQVTALATAPGAALAVVIAAVTGRLALPWACRRGVPAARTGGLGALVAGTVSGGAAAAVTVAVVLAALGAGAAADGPGGPGDAVRGALQAGAAVVAGLGVAVLTLRHAVRRLGGVTGDVLGALVELAATAALVVLAA
ncbi:adenosylcobinamide-GDP ribazoletransferase [Actinomadura viridis]|uniref:adenosylcobinamide-GDP ribazoletransferase n=1 Tax=Actinomadura viridis TaxID=58110 RepID=UPI00368A8259